MMDSRTPWASWRFFLGSRTTSPSPPLDLAPLVLPPGARALTYTPIEEVGVHYDPMFDPIPRKLRARNGWSKPPGPLREGLYLNPGLSETSLLVRSRGISVRLS